MLVDPLVECSHSPAPVYSGTLIREHTMFTIIVITLATAAAAVYAYFKWQYTFWKRMGVPYEEPSIPFGNLIGDTLDVVSRLDKMYHKHKESESPFFGIFMLQRPIAVFTDLNVIKHIFIKDFQYFLNREIYINEKHDPLSAHMFSQVDDKWRTLRTKLTPTFTSGKMKFMYPTIIGVADQFERCLTKMINGSAEVEIKELLARFTTDIIGTCAFGIDCNSLEDPEAEFRLMGREIFDSRRHSTMVMAVIMAFPNISRALGIKRIKDKVSDFFLKIVRETVAYREQNNIKRNDFMDLLIALKSEGALTIDQIAAQAFIFFIAGFETSSTAMTFSLYELALNHDIQEKARDEINSVLSKYDNQFTYEAMMEMKYIDQIINESLRKYPPLPSLTRVASKDYHVPDTNIVIPAGGTVLIPVYSIQRDPAIYPEPEKFSPDRFTPENSAARKNVEFLPFGEGPRNCVGLRFGMMQSRVGLVTLLRNYKFTLGERTPVPMEFGANDPIILIPEGGVYLKLTKL